MSREYTEEEIRAKFLMNVWSILNYWKNESRAKTIDEKMEGLAFSILVMLDGGNAMMPKFKVSPDPHPDDKEFYIKNGENYFPENCDIAGCLHELFGNYRPR